MSPLAIIPLGVGLFVCIVIYRYFLKQRPYEKMGMKNAGTLPGINPWVNPDQQREDHEALGYATSIEIQSQSIDHQDSRHLITNRSEILKIVSWLSIETLPTQIGWCAPFVLIFKLPNGLEIITHVWDDHWCFTGGPARCHSKALWKYLKEKVKAK